MEKILTVCTELTCWLRVV